MTTERRFDFDKAVAELPILRDFIDFVNNQVGVYSDSLAGFYGNKVRIERQKARVIRQSGMKIDKGKPVMMHTSLEDPTSPDVIHMRITRVDDFVAANSEHGFNEQQLCRSIIVFIFAYWDEQARPAIAAVRGVPSSDVRVDALGDLRLVRHAIIHNKGILDPKEHRKMKAMAELFEPGAPISLSHDQMHKLFAMVKKAIGEIVMFYTRHLPGAPNIADIKTVAIQTGRSQE
ncbi:hypothetical protein [Rhizobium ruizarguesonis]|uniref:hypothetical protein n=1 Tax=Rhizobium ruizarguesonis TaxID=2081791 RepID=UPI001030F94D|nr:hypothetical protein [Rhizobium ruizarguesonis]TBD79708.1 hypothetical protein ELH11_07195 [Rhizobium ruizarguesonis]TBE10866.1 hypothetical protein ELH09_07265 [Rhizobium ruizarguesonis]